MTLTKHAEIRIQQRCIPELILELLLQYGEIEKQHAGTELIYFKPRNFNKARKHVEKMLREFDQLKDTYLVKTNKEGDYLVITAGYLLDSPRTKTKNR